MVVSFQEPEQSQSKVKKEKTPRKKERCVPTVKSLKRQKEGKNTPEKKKSKFSRWKSERGDWGKRDIEWRKKGSVPVGTSLKD